MLDVNKAKEFKCNVENVRNVLVLSFVDNGAKSLLERLAFEEGYLIEDDLMYNPNKNMSLTKPNEINTFSTIYEHDNEYLLNFTNFPQYQIKDHEYMLNSADTCLIVISSTELNVIEKYTKLIQSVIRNKIKPIILINKLDLLIELFEDDIEQLLYRVAYIMTNVNQIIEKQRGNDDWNIEVEKDNVVFGSATHGWGFNRQVFEKTGFEFKEIHETVKNNIYNNLHEKIPISEAIFESIIANSPLTSESLRYRLPLICKNEIDIDMTRSMIGADSDGPLIVIFFGERYSEIFPKEIYCRIFCGSLKKDDEIHLMGSEEKIKVIQTFIYHGPYNLVCSEISAGKMGCIVADKNIVFGEIYVR